MISTGLGVAWFGRVDQVTETRDVNGDHWTTVTATDKIGALGAAPIVTRDVPGGTLVDIAADLGSRASIDLELVDGSGGLPTMLQWSAHGITTTFDGSVLDYLNLASRSSNAALALQRDGTVLAIMREVVTPSSVLTLSGVNAPVTWSKSKSVDSVINRVILRWSDGALVGDTSDNSTSIYSTAALASIVIYGERAYTVDRYLFGSGSPYNDLATAGGAPERFVVTSGELVVTDYSQDDLILLNPFEWVTESGTAWQVLSVRHDVNVNGQWRVSITADNLLDLL
jgi:hypothetical protein